MTEWGDLHGLGAAQAAELIREGRISSEDLVAGCLARVGEADPAVEAWAFLDPEYALAQAKAADAWRLAGRPTGPLHGVPVGVKDIFDTADFPTEMGSAIHAGRTPPGDAAAVARLRGAGAVILGKTVTTEFAALHPGKTRNPHHGAHTPGGSSSGSAAAVAAGMVPLAIGSQTNGSTIRPASFCGVYGFKPTHGLISRHGMLSLAPTLDQVGLFARSLEDIALLAAALAGYDERDPETRPRARIPFRERLAEEPPIPPRLGFVRTPCWELATAETREAFAELIGHLGDRVEEVELFPSAIEAWGWHRTIQEAEMAASLERVWSQGRDLLSAGLRAQIERGRLVSALDYQRATRAIRPLHESFLALFEQRYDALLTPAAPGPAPKGLASTGDPAFCTLWSLCGMPAISLPLLQGTGGLPIGVQLVGPREGDARLLRTARWLVASLAG